MPQVQANGRIHAYDDSGGGPPVLLLHSSSSSRRQWSALSQGAGDRFRFIAPDLTGYGAQVGAAEGAGFQDDLVLITEMAELISEPFHLVGHSYGGLLALVLARRRPGQVLSLCLFEPILFFALGQAGMREAYGEIAGLATRQRQLVEQGDPVGASRLFVDYWMGEGAFQRMPAERSQRVVLTMDKVMREFPGAFGPLMGLQDCRTLAVPTLIMRGRATTRVGRAIAEIGALHIARACLVETEGGHMAPLTHADLVAAKIAAFLDEVAGISNRATEQAIEQRAERDDE